ncbi:hypothetical protein EJ04DRAFT_576404 [Polyplosphaeria fusca]|uniref:CorA-like transporter domain-containing protein n=1 Tax=Polyplosphaeria fusca TaxID=682080 RepID=A0A9P4R1Y5_9PLEO|nr:hypothetical protein EJ04DRAFT_576404 [Polyplosphaeria fusca]
MDALLLSCTNHLQYPKNLIGHAFLSLNESTYFERLKDQKSDLFVRATRQEELPSQRLIGVDFLDTGVDEAGFGSNCVTSLVELKEHLREALRPGNADPKCRFVFLTAGQSRAALKICHGMFTFLFSYHQVMPSFLDFIFPFGRQEHARDSYFGGFREEDSLESKRRGVQIQSLGRSGIALRLCYNLRSVERLQRPHLDVKWSIRQSATYHSFDFETGQSLWINVKGNRGIKDRITEGSQSPFLSDFSTRSLAFASSLATHSIMCDWSAENWRWYINDMEDELQDLTRSALVTPVEKDPTPMLSPRWNNGPFPSPSRRTTLQTLAGQFNKSESFSTSSSSRSSTFFKEFGKPMPSPDGRHSHEHCMNTAETKPKTAVRRMMSWYGHVQSLNPRGPWLWRQKSTSSDTFNMFEKHGPNEQVQLGSSTEVKKEPPELPPGLPQDCLPEGRETLRFGDLQRIQFLEEKAQETVLVLGLNVEVLKELSQHYQYLKFYPAFPADILSGCEADLARFDRRVSNIVKDLQMLQTRTETLLRLLANRKGLLNNMLQYRSVKASEFFAKKAQESADNMEAMTTEMHQIAHKTIQETVSMRVITSVTLFFLPATFIATFMSTDIFQFDDGKQNFQVKGLRMYVAVAVPLTVLTFVAWYIFYRLAKRERRSSVGQNSHNEYV